MCTHTFEMYCKMLFLPASPLLKRQNRMADVSRLMRVERVVSEQPAVDVRHHFIPLFGRQTKKQKRRQRTFFSLITLPIYVASRSFQYKPTSLSL